MSGEERNASDVVAVLPVGVARLDAGGRIGSPNASFARNLGEEGPLEGRAYREVPALGSGPLARAIAETLADGRPREVRGVPVGGGAARSRYVDAHVADPSPGNGGPRTVVLTLVDVTSRVQENERARLFYNSFLTSTNPMEVTDAAGRIVDVNPAFERIYGYSRAECLGQKPSLVSSHTTPRELYVRMWADLKDPSRGHWSGEVLNRSRSGEERPVFLTITAVRTEAGEASHYVGVAVDLSEQKVWERQAAHADRLASLGQLAAGVAHEINTPLANVMLIGESIRRKTTDPWARQRVETLTEQVETAAGIVRGLLDFARRNEPSMRVVDLTSVTQDALAFVGGKQSAEVDVTSHFPEAPVPVLGDRGQLIQVLTNVLNNAYEAMSGQGRLTVEVREDGRDAFVEVSDSGPGIPPTALTHIFEPFFTTKPEGKGTGLGLAICHGIVQAHHGEITARNLPGGGASFLVALPLTTQPIVES